MKTIWRAGKNKAAKIVAAFAFMAAVAFPVQDVGAAALETTTVLGAIPSPGDSFILGNAFGPGTFGLSFLDHYLFSVPDFGVALSAQISLTLDGLLDLDPFDTALVNLDIPSVFAVGSKPTPTLSVLFSGLIPGNYDFLVGGEVAGIVGGAYVGPLLVFVIPEPEIYAMLLAGLGLMGFVARRRRQQAAA